MDIDVAAKRAFEDNNRKGTEQFATVEEQKQDMIQRFRLENERYWNLYHVHKEDMSNYDLVIDTTNMTPNEVANKIKEEYAKWQQK